jgi:hypothetical protein
VSGVSEPTWLSSRDLSKMAIRAQHRKSWCVASKCAEETQRQMMNSNFQQKNNYSSILKYFEYDSVKCLLACTPQRSNKQAPFGSLTGPDSQKKCITS